ncbi:nuclear transport factor 2 family protein [Lacibacterium aquatile]|uniref:Nuclear transport factor 2 family protein n=1 Tax=Lacibacterium aquatile TaxID=1168082 RepID=A0ABW5DTH9_9PROT
MSDDLALVTDLNSRFIAAVAAGDRDALESFFAPNFTFMAGETGEVWDIERFFATVCVPGSYDYLTFDQLYIRIDGDCATVSARTKSRRTIDGVKTEVEARFVDNYARLNGQWRCVFAGLWRL